MPTIENGRPLTEIDCDNTDGFAANVRRHSASLMMATSRAPRSSSAPENPGPIARSTPST